MGLKICRCIVAWLPITLIVIVITYISGFSIIWLIYGDRYSAKNLWKNKPFQRWSRWAFLKS